MTEFKDTNPKDAISGDKLPLELWPDTATAVGCMAFLEGYLKYGGCNWRVAGVRASVYTAALKRHMADWTQGQDIDPASGLPHLGKALACLAILVDAQAAGKMIDDRPVAGGYHALAADMAAHIPALKAMHADKTPRHYTIADNAEFAA